MLFNFHRSPGGQYRHIGVACAVIFVKASMIASLDLSQISLATADIGMKKYPLDFDGPLSFASVLKRTAVVLFQSMKEEVFF